MWRQIGAVISGIVFAYLLLATGGYLLYLHYRYSDYSAGIVARYVVAPLVALLTGALVGVIAKRRPGLLAVLSLVPSGLRPIVGRRLDAAQFLFMVFLGVVYLLIGAGAAWLTSRSRRTSEQAAVISG